MQIIKNVEKCAEEDSEYRQNMPVMKKMSQMKYKEVLRESLEELERKGKNFVCIYPAPGSEVYDKFFSTPRPLNKFLQRILFTDDLDFS
jgi:hypothetical protein